MRLRKHIIPLFIMLLLIAFIQFCRWQQNTAEWYMQNIYPAIATALSFISSKIVFSLYDIFIAAYICVIILSIILMCFRKISFQKWIYYFISSLVIIYIWFYMAWGISYFRFDFYKRVSISQSVFEKNNFKKFLSYYINELNTSYTYVDTINYKDIDSEIEMNYEKLRSKLNMPYPCGQRKIKTMIFQRVTTSIGISGYFGPFFNEVHVNFYPLPFEQASIIAHEKAHQFGISSEAECNLYAYIICNASNIKYIKYSGNYGILSYVLSNMRKLLPDEYHNWFKQIRPEIIADYKKSYEHWQKAINSKMSEFQSVAYDAYLKLNKIESGIENYSEMAALLVSWYNAGNLK